MIIALTILVGSLAIIAWTINHIINGDRNYWSKRGVFVAKSANIFKQFFNKDFNFIHSDVNIYRQLKGKRFGGYMELSSPVFVVTDLDLVKHVFIKDFDHFVDRRSFDVEESDPHFHFAMFNLNGDKWKDLRTKMSPTFTTGRIRRMFSIYDSSAKKMVEFIKKEIGENNEIELRPVLCNLAMDVIASAAFGVESNLFEDQNSVFVKMGKDIQTTFDGAGIAKFILMTAFPALGKKLKLRFLKPDADRFMSKLVLDALNFRQKTGEKRDDFLQLMIEAKQGKLKAEDESQLDAYEKDAKLKDAPNDSKMTLDDELIIAQSLVFFLGGFDTQEGLLSFLVYELGVNPDIQEKVYQEVKAATDKNGGELSYDIINSLEYLQMVVAETLRKYPIGARHERRCTRAYKIPDSDVTVEKDVIVAIQTYAIHHDPEYYPDPDKFDPQRFTKENISKLHPMAYQPFGHGPRNCIGNRFALSEAKTAIAHLLLNFKLEPCSRTVIPMKLANQGAVKPDDKICLKVTPRN